MMGVKYCNDFVAFFLFRFHLLSLLCAKFLQNFTFCVEMPVKNPPQANNCVIQIHYERGERGLW